MLPLRVKIGYVMALRASLSEAVKLYAARMHALMIADRDCHISKTRISAARAAQNLDKKPRSHPDPAGRAQCERFDLHSCWLNND